MPIWKKQIISINFAVALFALLSKKETNKLTSPVATGDFGGPSCPKQLQAPQIEI